MIRQNLLVLGLALITVTGCASTTSQNCGSHCSAGKQCGHQQHRCRSGRCRCNQAGPLFPGDAWGQPAGADLADGRWHHAAFTWNRGKRQQQLFVDGTLVATNAGPEGGGSSGGCTLGRANTGGSFIGGSLDEWRIYSRCLTADEVKALAR